MTQPCDVLVCGGGVVGLTAALAMARRGATIAVLDAQALDVAPLTEPDRRVYAINQASKKLFQQLAVWPLMDESRLAPYRHMHVWDAASGAGIDFDSRDVASSELGVIVEEGVIKQALLQALSQQDSVTCFPFHSVTRIEEHDDGVSVASVQQSWQTRLLLVADGGHSPARQLLNVPITTWPYHQHALVATIRTEKPHQQTAYQVFNPDGPLAFLPLVDEHLCSIVWSTTPKRAEQLIHLEDAAFNLALGKAFQHKLGDVTLAGARHQFPLVMRHTQQYAGKHWLLMGDAAHTIHPLAGLGLNIGLADVAAWLSCLDVSTRQDKALGSYQRQRKQAVWQSIALMGGLKTLFASPLPPMVALRGLGLNVCNRLTPLKRMFIEHAAG